MELTFLKTFKDLIVKRTGTNKDWAEFLSLAALSTAIGKNAKILTKYGPLQLNLFGLNIGASGLAKKTLPLRFYFEDTLRELENLIEEETAFRIPSTYTTEGLKKYFTAILTEEGAIHRDSGCIIRDEFSSLFKDTYHKKYMSGQLEFLSELYDGYIPSRYTVKYGLQPENKVFVNLVACSTPYLFTVMRPEFFMQGTGNRFLYVSSGSGSLKSEEYSTFFFPSEIGDKGSNRQGKIEDFAKMLKGYYENSKDIIVFFESKASKFLVNYKLRKEREATQLFLKDHLDPHYSYIVRLPEFAYKISALICIDRECREPIKSGDIEVRLKDAKQAVRKVNNYFSHFERLMEQWEEIGRKRRMKFRSREVEDLKGIIADAGGRVTRTFLLRRGFSAQQLNQIIVALQGSGEIEATIEENPHKPGVKATYYVLKEPKQAIAGDV